MICRHPGHAPGIAGTPPGGAPATEDWYSPEGRGSRAPDVMHSNPSLAAMSPRLYTPAQANATLPYVSRIAADIVRAYAEWQEAVRRFEEAAITSRADAPDRRATEAQSMAMQLAADIDAFVAELAELDVECKDPESGLIDFPAIVDGEAAWLCWRPGESEVAWYHSRDGGFAGRRPLEGAAVTDPESAGAASDA